VRDIGDDLDRVAGTSRPPRITNADSLAALEHWARGFLADQAGASVARTHSRQVTYTVHRLLLGGWIATVKQAGDQPRPLALSDGPVLRPERRAQRRLNLDEVWAAADVIESMLIDMRTRDMERSHGSLVPRQSVADSLLPAMSRDFASELLQPVHKGQAATFTEEFLQRWFANRRHRYSATG